MSSWIPTYETISSFNPFGKKDKEASPRARLVYEHAETIAVCAVSLLALYRSPGMMALGSTTGLIYQAYMSKTTTLDPYQKYIIEITDEEKTTRNDVIRHAVPAALGTLLSPFNALVGCAFGSWALRKIVRYAEPLPRSQS